MSNLEPPDFPLRFKDQPRDLRFKFLMGVRDTDYFKYICVDKFAHLSKTYLITAWNNIVNAPTVKG